MKIFFYKLFVKNWYLKLLAIVLAAVTVILINL